MIDFGKLCCEARNLQSEVPLSYRNILKIYLTVCLARIDDSESNP